MPAMTPLVVALSAGASLVSAHGYVASWQVGGTKYKGFDEMWAVAQGQDTGHQFIAWSDSAQDNGFVAPGAYGSADIICHRGGKNGKLNTARVAAGDSIQATWNTWPESHRGPVLDYLAPAGDPTTVDKTTLSWVKIAQKGLVSGSNPGKWATDELISNGLTWKITIPEGTPAGNYVLRHEIIALHSAGQPDGAQNYPQCVNIQVTGGSGAFPTGTVGTALYKADEKGIKFNLYTAFDSYPMPGPEPGFGGNSSAPSNPAAPKPPGAGAPKRPGAGGQQRPALRPAQPPAPDTAPSPVAPPDGNQTVSVAPAAAGGKSCKHGRHQRRHSRQVKA